MPQVVSPHLKTLIFDALRASFWRKATLQRFVQAAGVSAGFVTTMGPDETKRMFIERMFAELSKQPNETAFLISLANALAEQDAFPDLHGWEDSVQKIGAAERAVRALRRHLRAGGIDPQTQKRRQEARGREKAILDARRLAQRSFSEMRDRLSELASRMGTIQAGYDFQDWFYDLMALQEVTSRRPFVSNGRQIDGSVTVEGTTYLVELKFTQGQAGAPDIDSLAQKVAKKADNTMGVMVSMSGYSSTATEEASGPGTKLLLLDYQHVNLALDGHDFSELLARVRRHASQTGHAYLDPASLL